MHETAREDQSDLKRSIQYHRLASENYNDAKHWKEQFVAVVIVALAQAAVIVALMFALFCGKV